MEIHLNYNFTSPKYSEMEDFLLPFSFSGVRSKFGRYGDDDYDMMMVAPCCLPVSATALALWSVISYWLWQNVVSKHPKTKSKDIF